MIGSWTLRGIGIGMALAMFAGGPILLIGGTAGAGTIATSMSDKIVFTKGGSTLTIDTTVCTATTVDFSTTSGSTPWKNPSLVTLPCTWSGTLLSSTSSHTASIRFTSNGMVVTKSVSSGRGTMTYVAGKASSIVRIYTTYCRIAFTVSIVLNGTVAKKYKHFVSTSPISTKGIVTVTVISGNGTNCRTPLKSKLEATTAKVNFNQSFTPGI